MTDIPLMCPVEPHEMSKPMRRGFNDLAGRVAMAAALQGFGNDFLLRIYTAGIFHGVELQKRAASGMEARQGGDGTAPSRSGDSPAREAGTPAQGIPIEDQKP